MYDPTRTIEGIKYDQGSPYTLFRLNFINTHFYYSIQRTRFVIRCYVDIASEHKWK
nr:MAG TPA: hypothetical protein [Herelleviridae sp.]